MINLEENTVHVPGKEAEPILHWAVVFCTAEGSFETLPEAMASCIRTLQPVHTIMPLPAAFGENTFEVCLKQTMLLTEE